jgi:hypothetical protein
VGDLSFLSIKMHGRRNETVVSAVSAAPVPAPARANPPQGGSVISPPTSPQSSFARPPKAAPIYIAPKTASIAETKEEAGDFGLADELDYISINPPSSVGHQLARSDKASRVLGVQHRRSMEPIPASVRTSLVSTRSAREVPSVQTFTPTLPLTSLYVVSGLPKAPHTWTLADPDSVLGLTHSDGAVSRWWRAEVLGSTVSPGAGGGKKKRKVKGDTEVLKGAGALSKQEVGKMLSKALKVGSIHSFASPEFSYPFFLVIVHSRGRNYSLNTSAGFHCPYLLVHTPRSFYSSRPFLIYGLLAFFRLIFGTLRSSYIKCYFSLSVS